MTGLTEFNRQLIEEFRATRGSSDSPYANRPLLLLTTTGAAKHPDWYRNLVANPNVTVEVSSETFEAVAVVLDGQIPVIELKRV